ncbi:MAG: Hint domain-containing protein [Proteobacteria bacterium]|nr:Hint domain-containing protein [Pseudomonadota bacterium]
MTVFAFGSAAQFSTSTGEFLNPYFTGFLLDADTDRTLVHDDTVQLGLSTSLTLFPLTYVGSQSLAGETVAILSFDTDPNRFLVVSQTPGVDFSGQTLAVPLPETPITFPTPAVGTVLPYETLIAIDTSGPLAAALVDGGGGTPVVINGSYFGLATLPAPGIITEADGTLGASQVTWVEDPAGDFVAFQAIGTAEIDGTLYPIVTAGLNAHAIAVPSSVDISALNIGDMPMTFLNADYTLPPIEPLVFDATHLSEIDTSGASPEFGPVVTLEATVTLSPSDNEFDVDDTFSTVPFGTLTYQGTVTVNGLTGLAFTDGTGSTAVLFQQDPGDLTGEIPIVDPVPSTVCFGAGTLIATLEGELSVEALRIGDLILTADGRAVPVKWIGRQTIVSLFAGDRARPVRVAAGALGNALPHTDLVLTADHALILEGFAINAGALVNGTTVTLDPAPDRATYYHVETEEHDVILANGVPAETFVDYVGRTAFDNYAEYVDLYGQERGIAEMPLARISSARLVPRALRARHSDVRVA